MESKTVSIIVPVYKVEEALLRRCIESLLAQTLEGIEILLVDDGCPMGGGAVCEEYVGQDGRVRVLHQPNRGVSAARNAGMDAARGEYLTFVDGDDFVEADYCRVLYAAAEEHHADIVSCRAVRYDLDAEEDLPVDKGTSAVYKEPAEIRKMTLSLLRTIPLNHRDIRIPENHYVWAHLYRATRLDQLRFNEALRGGEDKYFNLSALQRCRVFCRRAEVLYHYVINPRSLTHTFYPDAPEKALKTYALYREIPAVGVDMDYRSAYYIRTCCMLLGLVRSHFRHPDNPDKYPHRAFRAFCREDVVAEAIRGADLRGMRLSKMKLAIRCLKLHLYGAAAWCARRWGL